MCPLHTCSFSVLEMEMDSAEEEWSPTGALSDEGLSDYGDQPIHDQRYGVHGGISGYAEDMDVNGGRDEPGLAMHRSSLQQEECENNIEDNAGSGQNDELDRMLELGGRFSRHTVEVEDHEEVDDALFQREFESYQAVLQDTKLTEYNRDQIRAELDSYLSQSLTKKGSDGKNLLSVPDNFEVIAASMSRQDLNSTETAPWSKVSVCCRHASDGFMFGFSDDAHVFSYSICWTPSSAQTLTKILVEGTRASWTLTTLDIKLSVAWPKFICLTRSC
jgi:hypothetical protein